MPGGKLQEVIVKERRKVATKPKREEFSGGGVRKIVSNQTVNSVDKIEKSLVKV